MSNSTNLLSNAASIAIAGGAVLGGLGFLSRKAWRGIQRWTRFLDDYEGSPARVGVAARPGVMERLEGLESNQNETRQVLSTQSEQLDAIVGELPKNGQPMAKKVDQLWAKFVADGESVTTATATVSVTGSGPGASS